MKFSIRNLCIATFLIAPLAFDAGRAEARGIAPGEAGRAAAAWARRDGAPLGATLGSAAVAEVKTEKGADGTALFHVVRLEDGGTVVTSAESGVEPVVAFFEAEGGAESDGNPLWDILRADLAGRQARARAVREAATVTAGRRSGAAKAAGAEAAWADLLDEPAARGKRGVDGNDISDLRVPALLTSTWDQMRGVANYYTPPYEAGAESNYPCGCVALAGAQIARFWGFPTEARPQTNLVCYVAGLSTNCTTLGGTYDWDAMPDDFFSALSPEQRQAVGKLCYDFGVATRMDWDEGGSGTSGMMLQKAFPEVFGYANAMACFDPATQVLAADVVARGVLANLDAGCPVGIGIAGHQAVADGYGYVSGTLYTHVNLGWDGVGDVWYNLPEIEVGEFGYTSSIFDSILYNIFPEGTGELLTGRVLDAEGQPVAGAAVTAESGTDTASAASGARGIYALWVEGGKTWTVTAAKDGATGTIEAEVAASVPAVFERTVSGIQYTGRGTVGNSWGNDIVLQTTVPLADELFVDAATGDDANDGLSWATAKASIQAAINRAAEDAIVHVGDGVYEPISHTNGMALTIVSVNGAEATVIDASLQWNRDLTNRCATLGLAAGHTNAVLVGFTLTNGIANGESKLQKYGGGALYGTLRNCVVSGNAAANFGGGTANSVLEGCTLVGNTGKYGGGAYYGSLTDCTVSGNTAETWGGGTCWAALTGCTLSGNTCGGAGGGAYQGALVDCTITGNTADTGGGYNGGSGNGSTLENCVISGNTATSSGGGTYGSSVVLTRCTVASNTAAAYGGGVHGGTAAFCTIAGNSANNGGGTYNAALADCTVAGNTAAGSGGGVYNGSAIRCGIVNNTAGSSTSGGGGSYGTALDNCIVVFNQATAGKGGGACNGSLTNCTVSANAAAANGGGVYYARLANCIVWGNTAPTNPAVYTYSSAPCVYSCLDQELTGDWSVGNIVADPRFVSASDWHLAAGSPCIDAGSDELAAGETDFYGDARVVGAHVDMGASEFRQVAPTEQRVAFNPNGGTCKVNSRTAVVGETYTKLASATREGYKFVGWYDAQEGGNRVKVGDPVTPQAERTLFARWEGLPQTVLFDANGGTCKTSSRTAVVGETYTKLASATREGYKFVGWYDAQEGGNRVKIGDPVPPQTERTLFARWEGLPQTVLFDANGGTCKTSSRTAVVGETYTKLASATRKGYKFVGWYDAQEGGNRVKIGDPVPPQTERTLFARWEGLPQTVHFDANGGKCSKTTETYIVGETYSGFKTATRNGYTFKGWYTAKEGGTRVKNGMAVTVDSERTLFAHWQATTRALSITGIATGAKGGVSARGIRDAGETVFLRFGAEAGRTYEVQWTAALDGEWQTVARWTAEADGEAEVEAPVPSGETATGFYRVKLAE